MQGLYKASRGIDMNVFLSILVTIMLAVNLPLFVWLIVEVYGNKKSDYRLAA